MEMIKFDNKLGCSLRLHLQKNLLLDVNFDKSTIELHFLLISSMLAKFPENQTLIGISLINCLSFKFFVI